MSFTSLMTNGYPAIADIIDFLDDRGIEIPTENNPDWYEELQQAIWGLVNLFDWAAALGVWAPSATTFNVRGGSYNWHGEIKTYTPGAAVNPTDNDTTYIWMEPDNTISSAIDGTGWPSTEHLKLAEIDVDASGNITAIRDLRGKELFKQSKSLQLLGSISVNLNAVATTNLYVCPTGKKFIPVFVVPRNLSATAGSTVLTLGKTTAKTDFLGAQTLSNLNAAGKTTKLMPVPSSTPAAFVQYTAGEIFCVDVTTAAGGACTSVFDVWGYLIDA